MWKHTMLAYPSIREGLPSWFLISGTGCTVKRMKESYTLNAGAKQNPMPFRWGVKPAGHQDLQTNSPT